LAEDTQHEEESKLSIKLIIKRKGFELITEGTISTILEELDALTNFSDKVAEKMEISEEAPSTEPESEPLPSAEEISITPTADMPVIKPSKRTIDNLGFLFNTPWGRTPRTVAEIVKALEINAVPDRTSSVNIYLTRMIQRGIIRRIEKEGKWAYFKLPT